MNHTPGPCHFEVLDRKFIVKEERTGNQIAVITEMNEVNLALVLGAPDLLKACKEALGALLDFEAFVGQKKIQTGLVQRAIAKAEGRAA